VTLGGSAFAGATPASIAKPTTLAARSTHRPYTLIRSAPALAATSGDLFVHPHKPLQIASV
jgi:hypothetical protein